MSENTAEMLTSGNLWLKMVGFLSNSNPSFSAINNTHLLMGVVFITEGFESFNATQMSVACSGMTQQNLYFHKMKMQTNPSFSAKKTTPIF